MLLKAGADATAQQAYGRTPFDYASETTSFVMLHSPLDRLKRREEVCRMLYPHMTRVQKQERSLTERKAIIIAQVPELTDPFKCRMMDYTQRTGPAGGGQRPGGQQRAGASARAGARPTTAASRSTSGPAGRSRPSTAPTRRTPAVDSKGRTFTGLPAGRVGTSTGTRPRPGSTAAHRASSKRA